MDLSGPGIDVKIKERKKDPSPTIAPAVVDEAVLSVLGWTQII